MQLFEGYTADELHSLLRTSRWIAGLLLLLGLAAVAFNQWLVYRIAEIQKAERVDVRRKLVEREEELRGLRVQAKEVVSTFDKLTAPRKLTPEQIKKLQAGLAGAGNGKPPGRLFLSYLTVEWDAEDYAKHLAECIRTAGWDVIVSDHLWVEFEQDGLFLVSGEKELPQHGKEIQAAFASAGITLPVVDLPEVPKAVGAQRGDLVLVVSNREG